MANEDEPADLDVSIPYPMTPLQRASVGRYVQAGRPEPTPR
jgi:hypothetical protein